MAFVSPMIPAINDAELEAILERAADCGARRAAYVLIRLPHDLSEIPTLDLSASLRDRIAGAAGEPQRYWFDHPIPIGVPLEANEVWYGLHGLDEAVAFEKQRGNADSSSTTSCTSYSSSGGVCGNAVRSSATISSAHRRWMW